VTLPAKHAGDGGALAESALLRPGRQSRPGTRMREGFNREARNDAGDAPRVN